MVFLIIFFIVLITSIINTLLGLSISKNDTDDIYCKKASILNTVLLCLGLGFGAILIKIYNIDLINNIGIFKLSIILFFIIYYSVLLPTLFYIQFRNFIDSGLTPIRSIFNILLFILIILSSIVFFILYLHFYGLLINIPFLFKLMIDTGVFGIIIFCGIILVVTIYLLLLKFISIIIYI